MFYKLKWHTMYRKFDEIGYLIYQRSPFDIDRVGNGSASPEGLCKFCG